VASLTGALKRILENPEGLAIAACGSARLAAERFDGRRSSEALARFVVQAR